MLCKSASEKSTIGCDAPSLSVVSPFSSPPLPPTRGMPAEAEAIEDENEEVEEDEDDEDDDEEDDEDGMTGADERESARRVR